MHKVGYKTINKKSNNNVLTSSGKNKDTFFTIMFKLVETIMHHNIGSPRL